MNSKILTHCLGFPRIGDRRELKTAVESYWQGKLSGDGLLAAGRALRQANWSRQQAAGVDLLPSGDFSFYDHVLDLSCLLGNIPARFGWDGGPVGLDILFAMARGRAEADRCCGAPAQACEMTKWFDTNYHYIVPEFTPDAVFRVSTSKPFDEFREARDLGVTAKPVLLGPVSYLALGKSAEGHGAFDRYTLLDRLLPVYAEILRRLRDDGAGWVQLDEPILATDLSKKQERLLIQAYTYLRLAVPGLRILLAVSLGELRGNAALACELGAHALHIDAVRAAHEIPGILECLPAGRILSLGIVDGRNIWRNDFARSLEIIGPALDRLGPERLMLAPSCSLLHVPLTLRHEGRLDPAVRSWLAFADEKLGEVAVLAGLAAGENQPEVLAANRHALACRRADPRVHRQEVRQRAAAVTRQDLERRSPFAVRQPLQRQRLRLPLLPTTTIGSLPQTPEVRAARARWKKGELAPEAYESFLEEETARAVRAQEELGLDVLVHGEFERNDMVEYFGEQLEGFAITAHGWVQSYGSRCVKPPILFGDVSRPHSMTVRWSRFAQSLTPRPLKGMLTGPITMLQWSFVRDDEPREATVRQIALALRDEVLDLEAAGLAAIQIDEPALREGLPLRHADGPGYLEWAVAAFKLAAAGVRDETQIHTHMCYCEFNDILPAIAGLDADVISLEASRSRMELLDGFARYAYPNEIGPGVYDIHSPRVPACEEMLLLLEKALRVLPAANLWVNPDCGLKTRRWAEVVPALQHMVEAARTMRQRLAPAGSPEPAGTLAPMP